MTWMHPVPVSGGWPEFERFVEETHALACSAPCFNWRPNNRVPVTD
jgi:hypothetical protein